MGPTTITTAKWAKAIDKRSPNQRTAHLLLMFDSADSANRAITNGLFICSRRCRIERLKREPTRCLKCQKWNHYAKDCTEEKDTCGNCAGPHRSNNCLTEEKACISCNSKDHASWSRTCPTFLRKLDEFNIRNPDNSLQYFPTADSWTWTATETAHLSPTPANQKKPSKNQLGKRPQQYTQQYDTYIPDYSNRFTIADQIRTSGEDSAAGPSNTRSSTQPSQPNRPPPPNSSNNDRPIPSSSSHNA